MLGIISPPDPAIWLFYYLPWPRKKEIWNALNVPKTHL